MTTLLSKILFDSCDTFDTNTIGSVIETDNICSDVGEIEPKFGTSLVLENSAIDDSIFSEMAPMYDCIEDTFAETLVLDNSDIFTSETLELDNPSSVNDHDCGFMLNSSGGMSTFDDSHGSTDWFDGEIGISNNCDF